MTQVQCLLCPTGCVLSHGQRGDCKARENFNGELKTLVYGKPCAIHIDPIEKKPLYHFYPGTSIFSIATAGCNLHCKYCQNWEISQSFPENVSSYDLSAQKLVDEAVQRGMQSIAYTYNDPVVFYEYTYDISVLAKQRGIKNVLVTAGYINKEPIDELSLVTDAANIDLKGFSEDFYQEITGGSLAPVLDSIKRFYQNNVWVELTNLIVPSINDDLGMIREMCEWIKKEVSADVPLHFSRFYPMHKLKNLPPTPADILVKARDTAKKVGLNYVYVGNVFVENGPTTFCPKCGSVVIDRRGYVILENNLKKNLCGKCGEKIPGRFF